MIIGTCGFSWSGSSAVADFLAEFDENIVYNDDEFILAYYPDGLEDLDFQLNTKCSKFISSTLAIPRFRKTVNWLLKDITHGKIKDITDSYLDSLIQVKWKGIGQGVKILGSTDLFRFLVRVSRHIPEHIVLKYNIPPVSLMEYSIKPDDFYEKTQQYVDNILKAIGLDLEKNIVLDQPFPGNNPLQCMKYFRNSKAIIVDRDPRDLYLLAKEYFPRRTYQTPHSNVQDFVDFYYHMHKDLKEVSKNPNVLCVNFEEMVFEYERTTNRIIEFLGLGKHILPKHYFKPERSMANTRLYKKCTKYPSDIKEIESQLKEFLFDFESYNDMVAVGEMFDENPPIQWKKKEDDTWKAN